MHLLLVILAILLALLLVLSIPIVLRMRARGCFLVWDWDAQVIWLYGLIKMDLKDKARRPEKKKPEKKKGRMPPIGMIGPAMRLVKRVLSLLDIKGRGRLRIGTLDPALTGEIVGYMYSMWAVLSSRFGDVQLRVEPDFTDEIIEGSGDLEIRARPIRLIPPILSFLITPEFRRFMFGR